MSFQDALRRHNELFHRLGELEPLVTELAGEISLALRKGGKVMFFGNGGSAADSQHLAAEFVVRYVTERRPLPAMALTVDTSILTAQANDYDFDSVFARQIAAYGRPEDLAIGITTSGGSRNVIAGLDQAKRMGVRSWGWTGEKGASLAGHCDRLLMIPCRETARIQEAQLFIGHWLCEELDAIFGS